jgi:hypothetical protein
MDGPMAVWAKGGSVAQIVRPSLSQWYDVVHLEKGFSIYVAKGGGPST